MLKIYFIKLLKRLGLLKKINFVVKKRFNERIVLIPFINGIGLSNLVLHKEWLDSMIQVFVKTQNKTFVDVGVNIGQTLLRLKTICPDIKYIGFEPNSTCIAYSHRLTKTNSFTDCIIQNVALSTHVSNLVLGKSLITDSRASLISSLRPNFFSEKEFVLALDYQSFYLKEKIGFVKIDVEGAEYEVLKGMEKAIIKHQPIVVCEVLDSHSAEVLDFTQKRAMLVCELLKSLDYGIIQLHTSKGQFSLVSFKKLEIITIKQWTPESAVINDYLFYPKNEEQKIVNKLKGLCQI
jgi:FkbM family methyltransferase